MGVVHGRFGGMFDSNSNGSSSKSPLARTAPDTTLTPIDQVKQNTQKNANAPHTSFLEHVGNAAKAIGNALTTSEKTVATGIARELPGGMNDIKAQQQQAEQASKSTADIIALQKQGKIKPAAAEKIIQSNADSASQASKGVSDTVKAMPTKKQLAGGFAGTALDIVTAGTLPELKGAVAGGDAIKASRMAKTIEMAKQSAKTASLFGAQDAASQEAAKGKINPVEVAGAAAGGAVAPAVGAVASKALKGIFGKGDAVAPKITGLFDKAVTESAPESKVATSALHIPGKNIYAELTPEQLAHLSDENANIPFSKGDMPHLTPVTSLEKAGVKKVSLDELKAESPNAAKAIEGVPTSNINPLPADIADAGKPVEPASPSFLSQLPSVAPGDTKAAPLSRNFVVNKYQQLVKPVQQAAKDMSAKDVKLLENIELEGNPDPQAAVEHLNRIASTADNPEQFHNVVNAMRDGYNARLANDQTLGRDVGVRNNYLPHLFDTSHPETAAKLDALQEAKTRIVAGNSVPGYAKPRTLDTYAQADEMGLKRRNANVLDDFYQSMNMAGYEHGKQAMIASLEHAHPGQVQVGKVGRGTDGQNYTELHIPGARGVTMPEAIAEQYNKRELPKSNGFFAKYDAVNGGLKYAKLGGGTFHALTTTGTTLGQQISSLNLLKHPIDNLRVGLGTLSKTVHAANLDKLASDGADHLDGLSTADRMNLAGVTTKAKDILGDANTSFVENLKNKNPVTKIISGIHDMVFDRQIPEAKALMFKQAARHLDANNPEDLNKMRKIASAVNNLGGINRAVDGLTPKTARQLSRVVLATDFTEGKFRTIYNGITKWGADSPQGKIARQMIVGKSVLFAVPGMAALVAHGQLDPSNPKAVGDAFMSQLLNPQLPTSWRTKPSKSNPNGTPISLKLPSTFISEIGKVIAPALDPLSPDKTAGIKDYASGRLAALPSVGEQVGTNRDYFGNPIYGKDKNGDPISGKKVALNISNQVSPIPVVQGSKMAAGQNAAESAANVIGFRATSDPTSAEAGHSKRISDFYNTYNAASKSRQQTVNKMNDLVRAGNNAQAARVAQEYNATIDQRTMPFRSKYADNYNPAFDDKFIQLKIPVTTRAFTSREKAIKESQAILK